MKGLFYMILAVLFFHTPVTNAGGEASSALRLKASSTRLRIVRLDPDPIDLSTRISPIPEPVMAPSTMPEPTLLLLGKTVWDLILNNNRPIGVDFEKIQVHALPIGVTDPMQLMPWMGPATYLIEMGSENSLGVDLFTAKSRVQFYYGAPFQGQGLHLANVTVSPDEYYAFLGFTGNVKVRASNPVYKGNGLASMLITIDTNIRGPLDTLTQSETFELTGDGRLQPLKSNLERLDLFSRCGSF